jgi:hypothetical protein
VAQRVPQKNRHKKENGIMHNQKRFWSAAVTAFLLIGLMGASAEAKSKDKSRKTGAERAVGIYLLSHTPLPETTISNIAPVSDPDRQLIQLTDNVHGTITLLDVGTPKQPKVLQKFQLPAELAQSNAQTRIGDATLFMAPEGVPAAHTDPQAVTLVSFADPANPKTLQKFGGVTAFWNDRGRELIYLANSDGLWILEVYSAADKRLEAEFEKMLY